MIVISLYGADISGVGIYVSSSCSPPVAVNGFGCSSSARHCFVNKDPVRNALVR